jgi:hypothetical protein
MVNFSYSGFSVSSILQRVISFFTGKAIEQVEMKVQEKNVKKAQDKARLDIERQM